MGPVYLLICAMSRSQTADITSAMGAGPTVLAMVTWSLTAIFGGLWCSIACAYGLAILRDTAAGNDKIENWPDTLWIDWISEGLYVVNPLLGSVAPGYFLNWLLKLTGPVSWLIVAGSFIVLFPILLLSVLEGNFPLKILSLPVLASVVVAFPIWVVFYIETAILAGLAAWGGYCLAMKPYFGIAAVSFILVTALVIYFRLLGRLADYCTEIMPRA